MAIVSVHAKRHRPRKLSLGAVLKQAKAAGQAVRGAVIMSDAIELQFGEPEKAADNNNPWDQALGVVKQ
jgi:hypothetical protein